MVLPLSSAVNHAVGALASTQHSPPTSRRNLKPRAPGSYDNELHGPDLRAERARGILSSENCEDSRAIHQANQHCDVPPANEYWFRSEAAAFLASLPKSHLWVPTWIARVAGHPARAVLLSWILNRFSAGLEVDEHGHPLCRARVIDELGHRWWSSTRGRIAEETLLEVSVVDRARNALIKRGLIEVLSRSSGLSIRPCAMALAHAFHKLTGDAEVLDELKHADANLEWFGSHTRTRTEQLSVGTSVHDALMVICERRPGPALILSHLIYWHDVAPDGKSRARISRRGHLWIARSYRQLAENPGGDGAALAGYVRWLAERRLVVAEPNCWCWRSVRDRGRPTLHVRPDIDGIAAALQKHKQQINRAIELKRNYLKPQDDGAERA